MMKIQGAPKMIETASANNMTFSINETCYNIITLASVAQWPEHSLRKGVVVGSTPTAGSSIIYTT